MVLNEHTTIRGRPANYSIARTEGAQHRQAQQIRRALVLIHHRRSSKCNAGITLASLEQLPAGVALCRVDAFPVEGTQVPNAHSIVRRARYHRSRRDIRERRRLVSVLGSRVRYSRCDEKARFVRREQNAIKTIYFFCFTYIATNRRLQATQIRINSVRAEATALSSLSAF